MAEREALTAEYVRQILHYDPETGEFHWKVRTPDMFSDGCTSAAANCSAWNKKFSGMKAGCESNGYLIFAINRRLYKAHRIAWLYMSGEWPKDEIDHKNLNRGDNRWQNLREVTRSQNSTNTPLRKDNTSGIKGVKWNAQSRKWRATIHVNKKCKHLGCFINKADAAAAYERAANEFYGEFARTI